MATKLFYIYAELLSDKDAETEKILKKISPYDTAMCNEDALGTLKTKIRACVEEVNKGLKGFRHTPYAVADRGSHLVVFRGNACHVAVFYFLPISYMLEADGGFLKSK